MVSMCKFLSKQLLALFYLSNQFFFSSLICDHDFTSIFILFTTFILTTTNATNHMALSDYQILKWHRIKKDV